MARQRNSSLNLQGAKLPSNRKVLLIPLCVNQVFSTDGTQTPRDFMVDAGAAEHLGPMIEKMRVHWEGEGFTTNFSAKVTLQYSVSGKIWSPATPADVIAAQQADGQTIGADYVTTANFGLNLRCMITIYNATGTAIESGRITAVLEVVLKS